MAAEEGRFRAVPGDGAACPAISATGVPSAAGSSASASRAVGGESSAEVASAANSGSA
ncbi:hypothetical protein SHJG_5020 [Streptomyces hygroscopicus subsp. jinggangensis 5008]|nr:hypothetical protein SHJG_5020 [Streptomyces hygroscopicus subsp. jinggangensis 5008]AGF64446.1 hypothetical protein SHJGH_4783 [Streptomyces hygroscopicus subsp. jinggangensis TL01]